MFHKAGGKVFFYIVTLMFFLLSLQNTWAFLNKTLPDASPTFLLCMMIVFEGGFMGWLAMVMHGAENVWRVGIAMIMLLITGGGVFTGAYFEIGGMMHTGIGYTVDPAILQWVPTSVLLAYMATGAACVLYMLMSPEFFARMMHINQTGQAPTNLHMYPVTQIAQMQPMQPLQFAPVSRQLPAPGGSNEPQLTLPAPRYQSGALPQLPAVNRRIRMPRWLDKLVYRPEDTAQTVAPRTSQGAFEGTVEPSDDAQDDLQSAPQSSPQTSRRASLGLVEKRMLASFLGASPEIQAELQNFAATHSLSDLTVFLQQSYPDYASFITEVRVQHVMEAYKDEVGAVQPATQTVPPAASVTEIAGPVTQPASSTTPPATPEDDKVPQSQNSAAPRGASAHRKPAAAKGAGAGRGNMQVVLPLLDKAHPGLADGDLAKIAGCSASTVSRWRLAQTAIAQAAAAKAAVAAAKQDQAAATEEE